MALVPGSEWIGNVKKKTAKRGMKGLPLTLRIISLDKESRMGVCSTSWLDEELNPLPFRIQITKTRVLIDFGPWEAAFVVLKDAPVVKGMRKNTDLRMTLREAA